MSERENHAVIVGCGRVGSSLARRLTDERYSVAVVDRDKRSFHRLGGLEVERVVGVGFDRSTLIEAGVERAESLAAVTSGDNSNIVIARTAAEHFRVPRVVARIFDPRRAAIYERLGIPTVASSHVTTEMAVRRLLPVHDAVQWIEPSARVCVLEHAVPRHAVGRLVRDLEVSGSVRVVVIRRLGAGIVPTGELVLQEGDILYLAVAGDHLDDLDHIIAGTNRGAH